VNIKNILKIRIDKHFRFKIFTIDIYFLGNYLHYIDMCQKSKYSCKINHRLLRIWTDNI
jgi:hypothetical protein